MRLVPTISFMILILIAVPACASDLELNQRFQVDDFLTEALLQVCAGDLDGDGLSELVVLGRDYTEPQAMIFILKSGTKQLEPVWTSPNILEEKSPVLLAVGSFQEKHRSEVVVLTHHRAEVFGWETEKGFHRRLTLLHNIEPSEATAGDWDGDGRDELFLTRVAKTGKQHYFKQIVVYRLEDGELKIVTEGPVLGNIRSLTSGDLDDDGKDEIIVEEGKTAGAGRISVFTNDGSECVRMAKPASLVESAVYGMTTTKGTDGAFLYTAGERGRLQIFRWQNQGFHPVAEKPFGYGLFNVAAGGFWPDSWGVALLYYPNGLWLLDGPFNPGLINAPLSAVEERSRVKGVDQDVIEDSPSGSTVTGNSQPPDDELPDKAGEAAVSVQEQGASTEEQSEETESVTEVFLEGKPKTDAEPQAGSEASESKPTTEPGTAVEAEPVNNPEVETEPEPKADSELKTTESKLEGNGVKDQ